MVRRLLPLFPLLLAGCALSPPFFSPATPLEVKVPVYEPVYCTPPAVVNPDLPIASLSAASAPADTIRAYAATVVVLKGTVRELNTLIEGCEEPAGATGSAPADGTAVDSVRVSMSNAQQPK
jgi:hypothetical protein